MTDKQINAAIAEACGWTQISDDGVVGRAPEETCNRVMFIPNYCTNLNAMHEAELFLDNMQQGIYWDHLKDMTDEGFDMLHATARQRAEAFLRTLGKWGEAQP